jgi:hypothetical protein
MHFQSFQRRCQAPSQVAKRFSSPAASQPASKCRRKSDVKYNDDDDDDSDEEVIRSPFNNLGNLNKTTLSFEPSASSHHVRKVIHNAKSPPKYAFLNTVSYGICKVQVTVSSAYKGLFGPTCDNNTQIIQLNDVYCVLLKEHYYNKRIILLTAIQLSVGNCT